MVALTTSATVLHVRLYVYLCCALVKLLMMIQYKSVHVVLCARWNEQSQTAERRKLRVAMLCGMKGDLQGAAVWQQDVIVITAGTKPIRTVLRSVAIVKLIPHFCTHSYQLLGYCTKQ